ncbi:MAG: hypothetical protein ACXWVS_05435 [Hyphomicrobium sp.]
MRHLRDEDQRLGDDSRENTWAIAPLAAFRGTDFFYHPDNDETQAYALRENLGHDRLRRPNL